VVNSTVMTTNGGNDFPGVNVPFGMVQRSSDTSPSRPLGGGYNFNNTMLRGFSLTHMAGPGCGAMQDSGTSDDKPCAATAERPKRSRGVRAATL
jgi:putative alpha-1,2-mannosidase